MDKEEAGIRAQSGQRPDGGYYSNSERIKLQQFSLGRITRLPGSIFGGPIRGGGRALPPGGGGGDTGKSNAIVVSPQASLIDRNQDLQIQQTQQSVGNFGKSFEVIKAQITVLENSIKALANQSQQESALEQKNINEEKENERKLTERKIRAGRESLLERKITLALARPIVALQQKLTNVFDNIMGALTTLFFGWLTNQGIEALKALSSGNQKKLEEIKWTVIKNVGAAIGVFVAVNAGFGLLMRSITDLTIRVASLSAKIALAPFRALGNGVKGLFGGKGGARGGKPPNIPGGGKPSGPGGFGGLLKGAKGFMRGMGLPLLIGSIFAGLDIASGEDPGRSIAGTTTGMLGSAAAFGLGSLIPIPLTGVAAGALAYGPSEQFGKGIYDKFFGKKEETKPAPAASSKPNSVRTKSTPPPSKPTEAKPQSPMMPASFSNNNPFSDLMIDSQNQETQEIKVENTMLPSEREPYDPKNFMNQMSSPKMITPASFQAPPKSSEPIGTLPEQKPNIIISDGGNQINQMSASSQRPLTDVPLIPSANPDNFYVLYSQLNYNVVM